METVAANHSSPPPRVNITTFFHQGEVMDYTDRGYSVNHLGVYNKHGKKLAADDYQVMLTCANGHVKKFGKLRLYHAVLHPLQSPEIEIASGFRAVDYDLPATDPRRYAYETAADRQDLLETNALALPDIWKPLVYTNKSTKFSQNYEIHGITGHIRRISKDPLNPNKHLNLSSKGQVGLYGTGGSGSNPTMISLHIAYMWTFKSAEGERRRDQTEVDHINGDHGDNSPQNLRWASRTENCLYKFKQRAKRFDGHLAPETMDLSKLTQFLETDIWCGEARLCRGSDPMYVIYNKQTNKYRGSGVGDFLVTAEDPYPMIGINGKIRPVHCLVAHMSGIISYIELESMGTNGLVVMHSNDNKEDFRPTNLKRGTSSENNFARHDNPATTLRKRVRAIETLESGEECVTDYESRTAAARAVNGKKPRISEAIGRKSMYKGMRWECLD